MLLITRVCVCWLPEFVFQCYETKFSLSRNFGEGSCKKFWRRFLFSVRNFRPRNFRLSKFSLLAVSSTPGMACHTLHLIELAGWLTETFTGTFTDVSWIRWHAHWNVHWNIHWNVSLVNSKIWSQNAKSLLHFLVEN